MTTFKIECECPYFSIFLFQVDFEDPKIKAEITNILSRDAITRVILMAPKEKWGDIPSNMLKIHDPDRNLFETMITDSSLETLVVIPLEHFGRHCLNDLPLDQHPKCEKIYFSHAIFEGYKTFDPFTSLSLSSSKKLQTDDGLIILNRYNRFIISFDTDERKYLNLLKTVVEIPEIRPDRTGVSTRSLFGTQLEFDLKKGFPLITTKKVFIRGVIEELLWFLRGQTNNNVLQSKNVRFWDGNSSKEFMQKRGLDFPPGELGKIYGYQWRHFNGRFVPGGEHSGGVDQIQNVIEMIQTDPFSRRLIVSAWNPQDLPEMALPPCHLLFQFYVSTDRKRLSCHLYQRSADLFLGVPFNIASYALLTHMIARITNLEVDRFIYSMGDAHIYNNHLEQVKEQLSRPTRKLPTLRILRTPEIIQDFQVGDFEFVGYYPHPSIKAEMAV